jgi:hypothetical protein
VTRPVRQILLRFAALCVRCLPRDRRLWGEAAVREGEQIESVSGLLLWVAGLAWLLPRVWGGELTASMALRRRARLLALAASLVLVGGIGAVLVRAHGEAGRPGGRVDAARAYDVAGGGSVPSRVGVVSRGVPFGPSIHRLRDLTARWLECEYAHGARKVPISGLRDSFTVVGVTRTARRACAVHEASAHAIQLTQAYADDASATTELKRESLRCVQAQGVSLSGAGVALAERRCTKRIEAARGIREPAPLP